MRDLIVWLRANLPKNRERGRHEVHIEFEEPVELGPGDHVIEVPREIEPGDEVRIDGVAFGPVEPVTDLPGTMRGRITFQIRRDNGYGQPDERL